ncbi:MAG: hypothetical protein ACRDID_12445 [Ktedonobacterales bacterium]
MENQRRRDRSTRSQLPGRWDAVVLLGGFAVFLALLGMLIANHGGAPNLNPGLGPQPSSFVWTQRATLNSTTPQEAYLAAMRLTPCLGAPSATPGLGGPARSTSITWIVATPNYGLAQIQAVCDPPARSFHRWLFELYRVPTGGWRPQGGYIAGHWSRNASATSPAPNWLALPNDTYDYSNVQQPGIGETPEASVVSWDAQTRLFVFGHIADRAIRPDGAASIVVDRQSGWMTAANGLVTVTVVRADGTTLFFSGTATSAEVQALAAEAFAHTDEALQPLQNPISTPSATSRPGN